MSVQITIDLDYVLDMVMSKLTEPPNIVRPGREEHLRIEILEKLLGEEDVVEMHLANDILSSIMNSLKEEAKHNLLGEILSGNSENNDTLNGLILSSLLKALSGDDDE